MDSRNTLLDALWTARSAVRSGSWSPEKQRTIEHHLDMIAATIDAPDAPVPEHPGTAPKLTGMLDRLTDDSERARPRERRGWQAGF